MRKDILAAGARKATYGVNGQVGDEITLHNVSAEGRDTSLDNVSLSKSTGPRKRFIPSRKTLLVRRAEAINPGGLLVTTTVEQEKPAEGVVLAVGPEVSYNVDDVVVFGKYAGAEFPLNGEVLLLMEDSEIKGTLIVEEEEIEAEPQVACSRFIASA